MNTKLKSQPSSLINFGLFIHQKSGDGAAKQGAQLR